MSGTSPSCRTCTSAEDVCVGVAVGTTQLLYPQAVGGDIGCGMLAVPFDVGADCLADPATAGQILARFSRRCPRGAGIATPPLVHPLR